MKKDILIHLLFAFSFFTVIILIRSRFTFDPIFISIAMGGLIGTFLPDLDRIIYIYILKPHESSAQKASTLVSEGKPLEGMEAAGQTAADGGKLIFHNANFQLLFTAFAFWAVTSSSMVGGGLALGFLLHLIVDQVMDYYERGGYERWFEGFVFNLDGQRKRWWPWLNLAVVLFMGLFL